MLLIDESFSNGALLCLDICNNTTPLATKTIIEHHRLISSILAQAEKELLIPYNPAEKATPPKRSDLLLTIIRRRKWMKF